MSDNFRPMDTATIEDPIGPSNGIGKTDGRRKNPRRMKFYEVYDYINQRYFVWTIAYALFYIIGGGIGYSKTKNIYCIIMGLIVGFILLFVGIGHAVDYYRGVSLESVYVTVPWVISMFVAVLMTCIYSLGSIFKFSLVIAIISWISCAFYFYAIIKDYSYGNYSCDNRFVEPRYEKLDIAQLLSRKDRQRSSSSSTFGLANRKKSSE